MVARSDRIAMYKTGASRTRSRFLVILGLGLLMVTLEACGAQDAGFNLELKNDTSNSVVVRPCNGECQSFVAAITLHPGQSLGTAQDADGVLRPIEISSLSNKTLGCLPFRFNRTPSKNTDALISQLRPCSVLKGLDEDEGPGWPYPQY
jgi:hypothetical protein